MVFPALGSPSGSHLALLLNAAPSFSNPKSVLVVALPAIEPAQPPPLHAIDPDAGACLEEPDLVLPVEGAPLVFSTAYAHDLVLRLESKDGKPVDLPVRAVAERGGLVVDAGKLNPDEFSDAVTGTLQGHWGFEPYEGPRFHLQNALPRTWRVAADDQQALVAGREGALHLRAKGNACVRSVMLQPASGAARNVTWKRTGSDTLAVTASLKDIRPGSAALLVQAYGAAVPDTVPVTVYAAASRLESFAYHAGDSSGVLKGADLGEVTSLELDGVLFTPGPTDSSLGGRVTLTTSDIGAISKLAAGLRATAEVKLMDGRTLSLATVVSAPRPTVALIAKSVQLAGSDGQIRIQLNHSDEAPRDAVLKFSIHAQGATTFSGMEKVEVATDQTGVSSTLTAASGGVTLENAQIAVITLDLARAFGPSAFGPLRFRLINSDGAGDWLPLGIMVRLPVLHELSCPVSQDEPCQLTGSDLFLIASISNEPGFGEAVQVPGGYPGDTLQVPHPKDNRLYVKLSDDSGVTNVVILPSHNSTEKALQSPMKGDVDKSELKATPS